MTQARIAVVGATGLVGSEVLAALAEANVPSTTILPLASQRSEGSEIEYGEEQLEVEAATPEGLRGSKVVVVACPGDAASAYLDAAKKHGALVVDVSGQASESVTRMGLGEADAVRAPAQGPGVAIVSPASSVVANLARSLSGAGLVSLDVTALWSAARRGRGGVLGLEGQTGGLMNGREPDEVAPFPHRLAFNIIPCVGSASGDSTDDEARTAQEVRALLGEAVKLPLTLTSLWVPTFHGLVLSFSGRLSSPTDAGALRAAFKAQGFKVLDGLSEGVYPMPMLAMSDDTAHVGRLRVSGASFAGIAVVDNVYALARTAASWARVLSTRTS